MTKDEAIKCLKELPFLSLRSNTDWAVEQDINNQVAVHMAILALEQEPCEDAISRQAVIDAITANCIWENEYNFTSSRIKKAVEALPPVTPQPKTGYISIDDVMSVFDDFMCGEVDEDGTNTFLEMLKDKSESEETQR